MNRLRKYKSDEGGIDVATTPSESRPKAADYGHTDAQRNLKDLSALKLVRQQLMAPETGISDLGLTDQDVPKLDRKIEELRIKEKVFWRQQDQGWRRGNDSRAPAFP